MLHFFFNRFSKIVVLMEIAGLIGALFIGRRFIAGHLTTTHIIFFVALLAEYSFLRFCALKRWYTNAVSSAGIGLHFKKAMVPTNYILACSTWCYLLTKSAIPLIVACALLLVVCHVNVILLGLHLKNRDPVFVKAENLLQGPARNRP